MSLSKAFVAGLVSGVTLMSSVPVAAFAETSEPQPYAQMQEVWEKLTPAQMNMVDLVAEDFFSHELSVVQQERILESQARKYQLASPEARDSMRQQRRNEWQSRSAQEREALLSTDGSYAALTEWQKRPFRLYAIDKLGLRPIPLSGPSGRDSAI